MILLPAGHVAVKHSEVNPTAPLARALESQPENKSTALESQPENESTALESHPDFKKRHFGIEFGALDWLIMVFVGGFFAVCAIASQ